VGAIPPTPRGRPRERKRQKKPKKTPQRKKVPQSQGQTHHLGAQFDSAPALVTVVHAPTDFKWLAVVDPRLVVARRYEYSLGLQRELPRSMLCARWLTSAIWCGTSLRPPSINTFRLDQQGSSRVSYLTQTDGMPCWNKRCAGVRVLRRLAPAKLSKDQIRPYCGTPVLIWRWALNSQLQCVAVSLTKRAGIVTATFGYTYSKAMWDGLRGG